MVLTDGTDKGEFCIDCLTSKPIEDRLFEAESQQLRLHACLSQSIDKMRRGADDEIEWSKIQVRRDRIRHLSDEQPCVIFQRAVKVRGKIKHVANEDHVRLERSSLRKDNLHLPLGHVHARNFWLVTQAIHAALQSLLDLQRRRSLRLYLQSILIGPTCLNRACVDDELLHVMSKLPQIQRERISSSKTRFVDSAELFARRLLRELRIVFINAAQRLLVVSVKNKNPHLFRSDYQVPAES